MQNRTVQAALKAKSKGFFIGHRLILPFHCQLLKVMVEGHVITEMVGGSDIKIHQDSQNTSIYLRDAGKLDNYVGTYKVIKLIVAEMDADLCDLSTHIKLVCEMGGKHGVTIYEPTDDMLFIE